MCGRFYTDNEIAADILRRAGRTADNLELPNTGDIYPSQQALILSGRDTNFYAETMPWGFPRFDGKGLLINARAETAAEKKPSRTVFCTDAASFLQDISMNGIRKKQNSLSIC